MVMTLNKLKMELSMKAVMLFFCSPTENKSGSDSHRNFSKDGHDSN